MSIDPAKSVLTQAILDTLPDFLRAEVIRSPKSGSNVHGWLFIMAMKLHPYCSPPEISLLLRLATRNCGREVPEREITDAISNSRRRFRKVPRWSRTDRLNGGQRAIRPISEKAMRPWSKMDQLLVSAILSQFPSGLRELKLRSPVDCSPEHPPTEAIIDRLFPGNPLLCCGSSPSGFRTRLRNDWRGTLNALPLIVPATMTSVQGFTKNRKKSERCDDNTGERRYLVIEFDGIGLEGQVASHLYLKQLAPLVLVVYSGAKSLHGWYLCAGMPERQIRAFFDSAVELGADTHTWVKSQMVRMPGAFRLLESGERRIQEVMYFDATLLTN